LIEENKLLRGKRQGNIKYSIRKTLAMALNSLCGKISSGDVRAV